MRKNPLVLNFPMIGANVGLMVKEIHEATLEGFEPVLSQCHNMFGSVTVTMVKKEKEVESVDEGISVGNTETSDKTGGEEDSGSEDNSGNDGHGEDASNSNSESGDGSDDPKPEGGIERDSGDDSTKPKAPVRKSTKKTVTPKA